MDKRILITGASSGIGRASALALAKTGVHLTLVARREAELREVGEECLAEGASVEIYPLDLTQIDAIPALVDTFLTGDGYPVLVNSAGVGIFNQFADLAWEDIDRQITLNLRAPARLIHSCLPGMLQRGGGQVINVLSMTCVHILPGGGGYSSAKAGLQMLGKVVSQDYRKKGIRVTSLMPGAVDTPIWDGSPMQSRMGEMIPTGEVASLIARLVESPDSYNMDEILMMPPRGVL